MKKLTRKLFLSVAALAVCAATLVSTTFAWYVTNQEATVTGMTGNTLAASDDGSVYVSTDGINFKGSVELKSTAYTVNGELSPITTADGVSFTDKEGTPVTVTEGASRYIQYSIWVKADKDTTVTPHFTVKNVTGVTESSETVVLPTQTAFQKIANAAPAGSSFTVDAVQALYVKIDNVKGTKDTATETPTAGAVGGFLYTATATSEVWAADKLSLTPETKTVEGTTTTEWKAYTPVEGSLLDTDVSAEGAMNAHAYYETLAGELKDGMDSVMTGVKSAGAWADLTLDKDIPVKLTFTIWLDGADTLCFDACAGQNFEFDLHFGVKTA